MPYPFQPAPPHRGRSAPHAAAHTTATLERLEPRVLLDAVAFPELSLLENPLNQVLRLDTTLGVIDIELLADAAPFTLMRFLGEFQEAGALDNNAFHRLVPGEVLQAGRVRYTDRPIRGGYFDFGFDPQNPYGSPTRPIDGPAWLNTFDPSREPLQWTVSLTEIWGGTLWAASLTFNLSDNPVDPAAADLPDQFSTDSRVIARVLPGVSRDTVAALASLSTTEFSLTSDPLSPLGFMFVHDRFPVAPGFTPTPGEALPRSGAVHIEDAELIKPAGEAGFFDERIFNPEGFAGSGKEELVYLLNPGSTEAQVQVIARFETGGRDRIVFGGTIAGNSRGQVALSGGSIDGIPVGRPYAVEVRSTEPLTATLHRTDFGAETGEAFTALPGEAWSFADVHFNTELRSFLVWQNTSADAAMVTVTFYHENPAIPPRTVTVPTGPLRRGGMNLWDWGLFPGHYGVTITADAPIVVAASQYKPGGQLTTATTELGGPGLGATAGTLPLARLGPDEGAVVTLLNPGPAAAAAVLTFTPANDQIAPVDREVTVGAGELIRFDTTELRPLLGDGHFVARFASDAPIVAGALQSTREDTAAGRFADAASMVWHLARARVEFRQATFGDTELITFQRHTIGVAAVAPTDQPISVTLLFRLGGGLTVSETLAVAPGRVLVFDAHDFAPLRDPADPAASQPYSVQITASAPVVVQEWYTLVSPLLGRRGVYATMGQPSAIPS